MLEKKFLEGRANARLKERRLRRRRRFHISLGIFVLILLVLFEWALWQPALRVTQIHISNGDPSLTRVAEEALSGAYLGILPHNSIFFTSTNRVRVAVLAADKDVAAAAVARSGLHGLEINLIRRSPIARWCGLAPTPGVTPYCYVFDTNGYIFAALPDPLGATTTVPDIQTSNPFSVYAPLAGSSTDPLGATIASASLLPTALDFARQVGLLGTPVTAIVMRGTEIDDLLTSGTRITYLQGDEESALTTLTSAKNEFNLADGSVEYIDLRFSGKLYLKRVGK